VAAALRYRHSGRRQSRKHPRSRRVRSRVAATCVRRLRAGLSGAAEGPVQRRRGAGGDGTQAAGKFTGAVSAHAGRRPPERKASTAARPVENTEQTIRRVRADIGILKCKNPDLSCRFQQLI